MKTLKMLVLAVAFTFSGVLSASTEPSLKVTKKTDVVAESISKLLEGPSFKIEKELNATVTFIINQNSEIVVLSVDTNSGRLESYIKNRLNYERLNVNINTKMKTFKVPVKLALK